MGWMEDHDEWMNEEMTRLAEEEAQAYEESLNHDK